MAFADAFVTGDQVQICGTAVQTLVIAQHHGSRQKAATVAIPDLLDWDSYHPNTRSPPTTHPEMDKVPPGVHLVESPATTAQDWLG